jgi:hypothetical protein
MGDRAEGGVELVDVFKVNTEIASRLPEEKTDEIVRRDVSWIYQVYFLSERFFQNTYRDRMGTLGGILQALFMGLTIMWVFYDLNESISDTESRLALIYITLSMEYYILTIALIDTYCRDCRILDREIQDNLYAPSAYFVAHCITSFPMLILQPVMYSIPIYYGCNLREVRTYNNYL